MTWSVREMHDRELIQAARVEEREAFGRLAER